MITAVTATKVCTTIARVARSVMSPKGPQPSRLLSTARLPKARVCTPATSGVNRKPIQADEASITNPIGSPWPEEKTRMPAGQR